MHLFHKVLRHIIQTHFKSRFKAYLWPMHLGYQYCCIIVSSSPYAKHLSKLICEQVPFMLITHCHSLTVCSEESVVFVPIPVFQVDYSCFKTTVNYRLLWLFLDITVASWPRLVGCLERQCHLVFKCGTVGFISSILNGKLPWHSLSPRVFIGTYFMSTPRD